jgi:hypothetical protein
MIARIANHAREHGFEVGQTYCDDAKSGLEIRRRTGLSQLLPGRLRSTSRRVPEIRMVRNTFEPIAEPEIFDAAPEMLVRTKMCGNYSEGTSLRAERSALPPIIRQTHALSQGKISSDSMFPDSPCEFAKNCDLYCTILHYCNVPSSIWGDSD